MELSQSARSGDESIPFLPSWRYLSKPIARDVNAAGSAVSFYLVDSLDLATLDGLTAAVKGAPTARRELGEWDGTYCPKCGDTRRMSLFALEWAERWEEGTIPQFPAGQIIAPASKDPSPSLFVAVCVQCKSKLTLVVYPGPRGTQLVALPETYGGLSTPNTPDGVSYYLDQAERSKSVGALSAAIVMYRSALEHLLHDQGFTEGMVGQRLKALEESSDPPAWRAQLHPDYMAVINKLANGAAHANDGDVSQQAIFEEQLLREVRELFSELLDLVYEREHQKASRIARLQEAAASIRR